MDIDYRKAAQRHLETCEYMLDHLDQIEPADNYEESNILMDIYYLSGYIIECASSFAMLSLNKQLSNIHNFQNNYIPAIQRAEPSLQLDKLIDNPKVKSLYKSWKTKVRYEAVPLKRTEVQDFFQLSDSIYKEITKKVKGK